MRVLIFALFCVLLVPAPSLAQNRPVPARDSLLSVLHRQTSDDTAKVNTLNALSRYYEMNARSGGILSVDTALSYARAALKLAENLHFESGTAVAYRYIGNCYSDRSDSAGALTCYRKALVICKHTGDRQGMTDNLRNIGIVYRNSSRYGESIDHYRQALDVARQMDDQALIAMICTDIGNTFRAASNYPDALDYYQQALAADNRSGNKQNAASTLMSIGWIYQILGDTAETLEYLEQALNLARQLKDQRVMADCLSMLGNVYMNTEAFKKSWQYYSQAVETRKALGDEFGLANDYANIAGLFQLQSDYTKALKYIRDFRSIYHKYDRRGGDILYLLNLQLLLQNAPDSILPAVGVKPERRGQAAVENGVHAVKLADTIRNTDFKMQALNLLIPAYAKQGAYKDAYLSLQTAIMLRDSIMGQETMKKMARKEIQYAVEKKAAQARMIQEKRDLRQRLIRNVLIIGMAALILFSVFVFRQRNKVKREKKRSEDLLLNILPAKVADELKETGTAAAHRFDNITVLFTDFVNFTGTSERLSPEDLVGELNDCFTAFDRIIERNGLEKIKTIGDAYMAVCGLPAGKDDHAQRAVQAALEILDFMYRRGLRQDVFGIRIGINSGPVVAGIVGIKKFAYDIWGDAVNIAARMEQNSEPGRINISESTYELVKDDFDCHFRGEIEAKNKGRMKMYFVALQEARAPRVIGTD